MEHWYHLTRTFRILYHEQDSPVTASPWFPAGDHYPSSGLFHPPLQEGSCCSPWSKGPGTKQHQAQRSEQLPCPRSAALCPRALMSALGPKLGLHIILWLRKPFTAAVAAFWECLLQASLGFPSGSVGCSQAVPRALLLTEPLLCTHPSSSACSSWKQEGKDWNNHLRQETLHFSDSHLCEVTACSGKTWLPKPSQTTAAKAARVQELFTWSFCPVGPQGILTSPSSCRGCPASHLPVCAQSTCQSLLLPLLTFTWVVPKRLQLTFLCPLQWHNPQHHYPSWLYNAQTAI